MSAAKEFNVNAGTRRQRIAERNGASATLQGFEHSQEDQQSPTSAAFPYLESISVTAKKNPYAMLTIIVSIASVLIIAVTTLSISVIGSVFIMYGTMTKMQQQQSTIIDQLAAVQKQQSEDGNAMRAYEAANGKRIEFVVGLMTPNQQARMDEYDRTHPIPLPPRKE